MSKVEGRRAMSSSVTARQGHRLLQVGAFLFLAALLVGIAVPRFAVPRLALSTHLLGLMQGLLLIVIGLLWNRLQLSATASRVAFWLVLFGCVAPLSANLLAAIWGAGNTLLPMAAGAAHGSALQERIITVLLRTGGAAMIAAVILILWGLRVPGDKTRVGLVVAALTLLGCKQTPSPANPPAAAHACVADSTGTLVLLSSVPVCDGGDWACRGKCRVGDAGSCLAMAYAAGKDSKTEAEALQFFQRACVLGAAIGCTNYAATVWAGEYSDDDLVCARRTFEKACAAKEPFACGMVGRVMLESTTPPPFAEGRRRLEAACDELGGFPCRVLAKHLETGKLGDYRPELIPTLLARACASGDPDACGKPRTAAETFR